MSSTDSEDCSFMPLLKQIAIGEYTAEKFLNCFADHTTNEDLKETLKFVAMREGEHGKAFEKRVMELGGCVDLDKINADKQIKLVTGDLPDLAKMKKLGLGKAPLPSNEEEDLFDKLAPFKNKDMDPQTGALMGRYLAEERSSGKMLRAAYQKCEAASSGVGGMDDALAQRLDKLENTMEKILAKL